MQTSLYLNTSTQMRRDEIMQKLSSSSEEEKIEAMQQIVTQMSQGGEFSSITLKITKEIMMVKNNELKRLFYYFMEMLPKSRDSEAFGEVLLLSNQVRKDLEHANEYVRGFVMRFVSTLCDQELIGNFYKLVKDNFNHPNTYVRRNAYFCLGEVFKKVKVYNEIPDLLYHALLRDIDPNCLKQAFVSLRNGDEALAHKYISEVSVNIPNELSIAIVEWTSDVKVLEKFLASEDAQTAMEAGIVIHKVSTDEGLLRRSLDVILRGAERLSRYKEYVIDELSRHSRYGFHGSAMRFLGLMDVYDLSFCSKCINFVFKISETHEFLEICDFLSLKFKETSDVSLQNQAFKVMLFEKMSCFAEQYSSYNERMIEEALRNIGSDNPEMSYGALVFLGSCFKVMRNETKEGENAMYLKYVEELVEKIDETKYGKILRHCMDIVKQHANKLIFEKVVNDVNESFEKTDKPLYLRNTQAFLGCYVCIELCEMCKRLGGDMKEKVIAVMLKFISYGNESGTIDASSHSTIIACIRSLVSGSERAEVSSDSHRICREGVLDAIVLPGCDDKDKIRLRRLNEFIGEGEAWNGGVGNVVQLSGLSDPVYVEGLVGYTRYEVVVEMMLINQTSSYLQNILIDFVSSRNLVASFVSSPFSLSSRSVAVKRYVFKIQDASNGFLSGSMTFKYPDESGEYANTAYTINFCEIRTSVAEFLESCEIAPHEFREMWKDLEWENTYTLKLSTRRPLEEIFEGVSNGVRGRVLDIECNDDYAVGNIVCLTQQSVYVLVNVCLRREESVYFECRIRSKKEGIVKSVSMVVGDVLKSFRNK
ncbi:subunit beta of coatomer complex [Ordospora colligata]|nr:subunit beta of coatomer complex [Ordospora colligata]